VTLAGKEGARLFFPYGIYGVDLFFVISGLVMMYTTTGRPAQPGSFFLRRCIRIIPIYFILTTIAFLIYLKTNSHSASLADYIRSILFIPYLNVNSHEIQPILTQGWTLNYEMFFYVLFACSLWFKEQYRVWACSAGFVALISAGIWLKPAGIYARTYTDPILLEFVFGAVIGYVVLLHPRKFRWLLLALLISTVAAVASVLLWGVQQRVVFAGIPAATVVGSAIWLEGRGFVRHWTLLLLLGDASYSLYLVHVFVLSGLKRVLLRIFDASQMSAHLMCMFGGLAAAGAAAVLLYKLVESPLMKYLQGVSKRITAKPERKMSAVLTGPR
jgi:peptidoglycan/LPS O-acetylase OafA/YrhL